MAEPVSSGVVLETLVLCGLMGALGQGIRAAVGLKNSLGSGQAATQQTSFNAAYFALSMMIGSIAGILAGLALGLSKLTSIDPDNLKLFLGIAAAGYAGADFIENTFSIVFPDINRPPTPTSPTISAPLVQALSTHTDALNTSTAAINTLVSTLPPAVTPVPPFDSALRNVASGINTQTWVPALSAAFGQFGLTTNKRIAAAIGQFLVEAGENFQEIIENLRYTHASRLVEIFPREFPTEADAAPYVNNPEALGNRVYANRLGNGDEGSGDGYRFRGRGLIQLTGRGEYTEFGESVGMTAEQAAAYCETPKGAATSGCWYLSTRGCLPMADAWNIDGITRAVNGAKMVDRAKRAQYSNDMLQALGG